MPRRNAPGACQSHVGSRHPSHLMVLPGVDVGQLHLATQPYPAATEKHLLKAPRHLHALLGQHRHQCGERHVSAPLAPAWPASALQRQSPGGKGAAIPRYALPQCRLAASPAALAPQVPSACPRLRGSPPDELLNLDKWRENLRWTCHAAAPSAAAPPARVRGRRSDAAGLPRWPPQKAGPATAASFCVPLILGQCVPATGKVAAAPRDHAPHDRVAARQWHTPSALPEQSLGPLAGSPARAARSALPADSARCRAEALGARRQRSSGRHDRHPHSRHQPRRQERPTVQRPTMNAGDLTL
mmetsp:Transcript_122167/g.211957  ORF Transcript_122167/g.211957 Transcript_122167/m.211957 type:complete len:300 (+) Transcript_122167:773-1672(+)